MKLKDKVAVVTGAASGLGRAIALRYVQEGARVAIADLDLDAANAVAAGINAAGGKAMGVAMDVTSEAQVDAGIDAIAAALGGRRCSPSTSTARFSRRARASGTCTGRGAAAASS